MSQPPRKPTDEIPVETHLGEDSGAASGAQETDPLDELELGMDPSLAGNKPGQSGTTVAKDESGASSGAGTRGGTATTAEVASRSNPGRNTRAADDLADETGGGTNTVAGGDEPPTTENQPS